jgi:hypothetical protein
MVRWLKDTTGQCHRYREYDLRPVQTIGELVSTDLARALDLAVAITPAVAATQIGVETTDISSGKKSVSTSMALQPSAKPLGLKNVGAHQEVAR